MVEMEGVRRSPAALMASGLAPHVSRKLTWSGFPRSAAQCSTVAPSNNAATRSWVTARPLCETENRVNQTATTTLWWLMVRLAQQRGPVQQTQRPGNESPCGLSANQGRTIDIRNNEEVAFELLELGVPGERGLCGAKPCVRCGIIQQMDYLKQPTNITAEANRPTSWPS